MDDTIKSQLYLRNRRIIEAVITKAKTICPGAVDLIAVTGSFHSGDYYERSDLDLLIVINDEIGLKLAKCFILDDVAFDIYCNTWDQLELMSEYNEPHVVKLMDVDIVYCANDEVRWKYNMLHDRLTERLRSPIDRRMIKKIRGHYDCALREFGRMCVEDSSSICKYISAKVIYYIEYVIYMLNQEYIRHGVKGIPAEICSFGRLPYGFCELYRKLIFASDINELRYIAGMLIKNTGELIDSIEREMEPLPQADSNSIRGTYEEMYSNWRNKIHRAAEVDDVYLSLMSSASAQNFYDELSEDYSIGSFNLFEGWQAEELRASADHFDEIMEKYRENYVRAGMEICRYDNIDKFILDYLYEKMGG
ncbi:MAG: hypothetical protein HFE63_03645 [Clostridiales bacterium]|nr:hypothetical protein [Clostridiales bacterium]